MRTLRSLLRTPRTPRILEVNAAALLVLAITGPLVAAPGSRVQDPDPVEEQGVELPSTGPWLRRSIERDSGQLEYLVRAETTELERPDGSPWATIFSTQYRLEGGDPATRPITYVFNGGPGSSSVWLHLGLFGPRRVEMAEGGFAPRPPYRCIDNPHTLLDRTDLVFIDPVSTGYSRAADGVEPSEFHGIDEDLDSVAEFIRLHLSRNARWASPKFLAGESYGTTRAAGLSVRLLRNHGIALNGIVLVSSILNFQTARFDTGNDLPYALFLPTYTATAWYHGKLEGPLAGELEATLEEARAFAEGEYTLALMKGDRLAGEARAIVARKLARFTGLSVEFVEGCDLRVNIGRFVKELRRGDGLTVGRLDSRFQGIDRDNAGEEYEYDPSYAAIQAPYSACMNDYLRRELGFETDRSYEILTGNVHPWSYARFENRYTDTSEDLRSAMTRNRDMHVHVANGYFDLATPFFATEYTFAHLGLPEGERDRISMAYYASGHMMYIDEASLAQQAQDLGEFFDRCLDDGLGR